MRWWWEKYRKFAQLAIIIIIMVIAISYINEEVGSYKTAQNLLRRIIQPAQDVVYSTTQRISATLTDISEIGKLRQENERLQDEIERMNFLYGLIQEVRAENTRLLRLVNFQETVTDFEMVAARVIAREPGNWYNTITINKGTGDGLALDMPVITHKGLVGRITSIGTTQAEVLLLMDQRSSVGGIVRTTREAGVVKGFAADMDSLRMYYLPRDAKVMPGDIVVTSGFGGIYPRGFEIGRVSDVRSEDYDLAKYAVIEPSVDFDHLEEVLVVVSGESRGQE